MSPRTLTPPALAVILTACATPGTTARPELPPPAREIRAGVRAPDAGSVPPSTSLPVTHPPHEVAVRAAIEAARGFVGQREITLDGRRYGDDCVALVRAAFARAGVALPTGATTVAGLHQSARARALLRRGAPVAGDVIFLADRPGGSPAHVGIVESVGADGTALVLHRTGRGVARFRVNASHPWKLRGEKGRLLNDPLVTGSGRVPAGRLFLAWASLV